MDILSQTLHFSSGDKSNIYLSIYVYTHWKISNIASLDKLIGYFLRGSFDTTVNFKSLVAFGRPIGVASNKISS